MPRDPRIVCLESAAQDAADSHDIFHDVTVLTRRDTPAVMLYITAAGPVPAIAVGDLITASTCMDLERLDELLRDLLAARADLIKLTGGAT